MGAGSQHPRPGPQKGHTPVLRRRDLHVSAPYTWPRTFLPAGAAGAPLLRQDSTLAPPRELPGSGPRQPAAGAEGRSDAGRELRAGPFPGAARPDPAPLLGARRRPWQTLGPRTRRVPAPSPRAQKPLCGHCRKVPPGGDSGTRLPARTRRPGRRFCPARCPLKQRDAAEDRGAGALPAAGNLRLVALWLGASLWGITTSKAPQMLLRAVTVSPGLPPPWVSPATLSPEVHLVTALVQS